MVAVLAAVVSFAPPEAVAEIAVAGEASYSFFLHDFDGDGLADLASLEGRRLSLFRTNHRTLEPAGAAWMTADLPAAVAVASPARREAGKRVVDWIGMGRDGLWRLKTAPGERFERIVSVTTSVPAQTPKPQMSSFAADLDHDGVDELIVPRPGALSVWRRGDNGDYAQASQVVTTAQADRWFLTAADSNVFSPFFPSDISLAGAGPSVFSGATRLAISHSAPSLAFSLEDRNGDGRLDIIEKASYDQIHLQGDDLTFEIGDAGLSVYAGYNDFTFTGDFDGDGVVDGLDIKGRGELTRQTTVLSFYKGTKDGASPGVADESRVVHAYTNYEHRVPVVDFNNDGHYDIMLLELDLVATSLQSNLQAYFKKGLDVELHVYLWDPKGGKSGEGFFVERPSFRYPLKVTYEVFGLLEDTDFPIVVDHDFTGDGLPDLVTKTPSGGGTRLSNKIGLFAQRSDGKGYDRRALKSFELNHGVQNLYPRDIDGRPPVEVLCVSAQVDGGRRQASVIRLK